MFLRILSHFSLTKRPFSAIFQRRSHCLSVVQSAEFPLTSGLGGTMGLRIQDQQLIREIGAILKGAQLALAAYDAVNDKLFLIPSHGVINSDHSSYRIEEGLVMRPYTRLGMLEILQDIETEYPAAHLMFLPDRSIPWQNAREYYYNHFHERADR